MAIFVAVFMAIFMAIFTLKTWGKDAKLCLS